MTDRPHIRTEVAPGRFHYRPAPDPAWREQEVVPDQARRGPLSEEDAGMKPEQRVRYTGPDVRGELLNQQITSSPLAVPANERYESKENERG